MFPQVLRAGVQLIADSAYQTVDTTFEDWAHVVQSNKDTELYAPLHGISFPKEVGRQETFPESAAAGLDIKLVNRKYGQIFGVEKELMDDDQTAQFQKQASLIGEYLKLVLEVLCYGKLASVSGMAYAGMSIPVSETQPSTESTYPWSTALRGGGANRPSSYGALSQANIQSAQIALMNQKNLLGLKMMINPNRIIISPAKHFDLSVLLNSAYYPSGAATAGAVGGAFAINPMKGLANATVSRFMFANDGTVSGNSTAWYLCDDSKPFFVAQVREAASVIQENPASGQSFDRDIIRFKGQTRCNADFIDPRFIYQGNDGSV
jgi:phage major head subunit gpT-like protein